MSHVTTVYLVNFVDPTHYLHPLPPEIYLLFWHYSPVLGNAFCSQNYASIFGQSLLGTLQNLATLGLYDLANRLSVHCTLALI